MAGHVVNERLAFALDCFCYAKLVRTGVAGAEKESLLSRQMVKLLEEMTRICKHADQFHRLPLKNDFAFHSFGSHIKAVEYSMDKAEGAGERQRKDNGSLG